VYNTLTSMGSTQYSSDSGTIPPRDDELRERYMAEFMEYLEIESSTVYLFKLLARIPREGDTVNNTVTSMGFTQSSVDTDNAPPYE